MNANEVEQSVRDVLGDLKGILRDADHESAAELTNAGEPGVALDLICEQLFEYEIAVPRAVYAKLAKSGQLMHMPERTWTVLQPLVIG